ncbi:hypothetical protein [Glaciibacter psychrotolerans]|uniref:Type IV toxin-antitoxin system AbiEi family antitoxin domain-containing protein n=1 Tax=Glaciibacter psychrotolerans TaxID=670054 RepID=A0A7Z0J7J0_9MICO|nr:hypothetical protein [Leifsonia psychrotolerans]NYJ21023.1 hypothetical protein [Leifsonia psychrotolerans]
MNGLTRSESQHVLLTRDLERVGADGRSLRRGLERGQHRRLLRGVYVATEVWNDADDDARHIMRIQAALRTRRDDVVVSHVSAARLWGLPILGRWPLEVHLKPLGGRIRESKNGIIWHHDAFANDEVVELDGVLVTSRLRTLVDLARSSSFASAVATLDAGLSSRFALPNGQQGRLLLKEDMLEEIARLGPVRGCRAARLATNFADGDSGSVGESASRANIYLSGMPAPRLQVSYPREDGGNDITDFTWKKEDHIQRMPLLGEFDGFVKYTRSQYLKGRTIEDVVWEEKVREDRLRAPGRAMSRWLWKVAMSPVLLRAHLLEAGLRPHE